jgi:exonuclease III
LPATPGGGSVPSADGSGTRRSWGVVPGLRDLGYRDAFRALNGYARREPSWTWRQVAGHGGGWRIDHLFASEELHPTACGYHHAWRDAGLSDHSPLEADVER